MKDQANNTASAPGYRWVYLFFFACIAVKAPYIYRYFKQIGLSAREIAILSANWPFILFLAQPVWGLLADRTHRHRTIIVVCALISSGLAIGYIFAQSFFTFLLLSTLHSFFHTAIRPLLDTLVLNRDKGTNRNYGSIRMWGALSFVITVPVVGILLDVVGLWILFLLYGMFNVGIALTASFCLPESAPPSTARRPSISDLKNLLFRPTYLLLLLTVFFHQVAFNANAVGYGLFWDDFQTSFLFMGLSWSAAAFLEVPLLRWSPHILKKFSPVWLLGLALFLATLRWALMAVFPDPDKIIWIQIIHSFQFIGFILGSMYLAIDLSPGNLRTSGQTWLNGVAFGLAAIVGNLSGGLLYLQGYAFFYIILSLICLAGCVTWIFLHRSCRKMGLS